MPRLNKHEITRIVLSQLSNSKWHDVELGTVIFQWWNTGRSGQGLGLSKAGMLAFEEAEITYYTVDVELQQVLDKLGFKHSKSLVALNHLLSKYLPCPYFLDNAHKSKPDQKIQLRIYDQPTAVLIALYGDVAEYIVSIKNKSH